MQKQTHRSVKFNKADMEYDIPDELDLSKLKYLGRGKKGMEAAAQLARQHRAERLVAQSAANKMRSSSVVHLEPDVAKVFQDSISVNEVLRAIIHAMTPAISSNAKLGQSR